MDLLDKGKQKVEIKEKDRMKNREKNGKIKLLDKIYKF